MQLRSMEQEDSDSQASLLRALSQGTGGNAPPTRRRSSSRRASLEEGRSTYEFGGLILSELAILFIWSAFWLLNGYFTALFMKDVLLSTLPPLGIPIGPLVAWSGGILIHLIISLIEQHLWRAGGWDKVIEIVIIGSLDVFTTASGILMLARLWHIPTEGIIALAVVTVLAIGLAIIPERRIVRHGLILWQLVRK